MEWIDVNIESPDVIKLGGKEILVLVNGNVYLCSVMGRPRVGILDAYVLHNNFIYSAVDGWCGDPRFAKPTHWMEIPEAPWIKSDTDSKFIIKANP